MGIPGNCFFIARYRFMFKCLNASLPFILSIALGIVGWGMFLVMQTILFKNM